MCLRLSLAYKLRSGIAGSYICQVLNLNAMLLSRVATHPPPVYEGFYSPASSLHLVLYSFPICARPTYLKRYLIVLICMSLIVNMFAQLFTYLLLLGFPFL